MRETAIRARIGTLTAAALIMSAAGLSADLSTSETKRIQEAATVLKEIRAVPDNDIPRDLWNSA